MLGNQVSRGAEILEPVAPTVQKFKLILVITKQIALT